MQHHNYPDFSHFLSGRTPAKSVRMEDVVGSIVRGRVADFFVVDEDWTLERVYISGKSVSIYMV